MEYFLSDCNRKNTFEILFESFNFFMAYFMTFSTAKCDVI